MPHILINIYLFAAAQGIILSILLFTKKQNKHANRVLSIAVLTLSLDLISEYINGMKYYEACPFLFKTNIAFPFIYGPAFYLYTLILSSKEGRFKPIYLLNFLPFILFHLYLSPFYFLSHSEKLLKINEYLTTSQLDLVIINMLKPVHGLIYSVISLKTLSRFRNSLRNSYSNLDKIKISWLKYLLIGTTIVWSIVALSLFSESLFTSDFPLRIEIIYISISLLIFSIGYGALSQSEVFKVAGKTGSNEPEPVVREKYEKSSLEENDIEKIKHSLLFLMDEKKLYLNSDLTLTQLAEELNISNHNLSETINKSFNKNFYDFINSYRIEEFKSRIKNPDYANYNLLALAFESGFSSKSAFNTIFKKATHQTPSEYRKQNS